MRIVFYTGYHHCDWNANQGDIAGSETAVVNVARYLVGKYGHKVTVVGDRVIRGCIEGVYYCTTSEYRENRKQNPATVDMVIGVNYIHFLQEMEYLNAKDYVFWAHNPEHFPWYKGELMPNNGDDVYSDDRLSTVICVSEWHKEVFAKNYPNAANKIRVIPNGINTFEEFPEQPIEKVANRFIYTSASDRGLDYVLELWPRIRSQHTNAQLVVCCPGYAIGELESRMQYMEMLGVTIKGTLSKPELYREMCAAEFWLYPSKYDETFCITALEMMYANCIPITTDTANLKYLIGEEHGLITPVELEGNDFIEHVAQNVNKAVAMTDSEKNALREKNWNHVYNGYTWFDVTQTWANMLEVDTVREFFDRIFIISMDPSSSENKARWEEQLTKAGLGNVPCELVQGVNGALVDDDYLKQRKLKIYKDWKIESDNNWWNRDVKPGEIGCALSHYGVWTLIKSRGYKSALILEEDVMADRSITNDDIQNVPDDWDMLYLGRNPLEDDREVVNDNVVVPGASYNTHAYAVSNTGVEKILQQNLQYAIMPVDEFLIATYVNHPREDLNKYIWKDNIAYALSSDVFHQTSNAHTSMTENIDLIPNESAPVEYIAAPVPNQVVAPAPVATMHKHPDLYTYFEDFDGWCAKFLNPSILSYEWDLIVDEPIDGVFCVPFFTDEFCTKIREEADYLDQWTTDRHDFYPTTDIVIDKIGFNEIYNDLLKRFVMPMNIHMFELEGEGWDNMESENFLAKYTPKAQGHLSIHHDASDITALVNLSQPDDEFTGGGTWFRRQKSLYRPPKGSLSIHPGNITHKHGARAVTSGQRFIMVSFMKNVRKPF